MKQRYRQQPPAEEQHGARHLRGPAVENKEDDKQKPENPGDDQRSWNDTAPVCAWPVPKIVDRWDRRVQPSMIEGFSIKLGRRPAVGLCPGARSVGPTPMRAPPRRLRQAPANRQTPAAAAVSSPPSAASYQPPNKVSVRSRNFFTKASAPPPPASMELNSSRRVARSLTVPLR